MWEIGAQAIKHLFDSKIHEVTFFGHTWDENHWRASHASPLLYEKLNAEKLRAALNATYKLTDLSVEKQVNAFSYENAWLTWAGMAKSAAIVNNLKTQHEINNDVKFDLVFHARWDGAFNPDVNIDDVIERVSIPYMGLVPDVLYSECNYFPHEYRFPCINDMFYFGSSRTMNIVQGFWHYYRTGNFYKLLNYNMYYNPAWDKVGMGCLLYKWCTMKNIKFVDTLPTEIKPCIVRQSQKNSSWPQDHHKIWNAFLTY